MYELILWRHADAVDGYPDLERQLTSKGHAQAKLIATWLDERLPKDALILVSPALRAQQTAHALRRAFVTCADIATGAEARDVLKAARWPHAAHPVLIVGHQPTLGQTALLLLTGAEGDLSVKKGSVWWISGSEPGACSLRAMMSPGLA